MQTFLPDPDFTTTARLLDQRRLGKQRVEVLQILRALTREGYGWSHHPAVLMWRGHEEALARYGLEICREWCRRGYADTCAAKILDELRTFGLAGARSQGQLRAVAALPSWLGDDALHRSHRAALVRKNREHYQPLFGDVPSDLEYVWPVRRGD